MYKNEIEIDILRCLRALAKKKKFIVLFTVLFGIIGVALTLQLGSDKYCAKTTVYAAADKSYMDAANAATAMQAYVGVANSYKVCQRAALLMGRSDIEASDVQDSMYVVSSADEKYSSSTYGNLLNSATIISFYATTSDSELSMEMADAVAQAYTIEMANILHVDSVKVLDNAHSSEKTYDAFEKAWKKRIKFAILGFGLACILVVLCEVLDPRVRTIREATIKNSIPVIGIIPDYKE